MCPHGAVVLGACCRSHGKSDCQYDPACLWYVVPGRCCYPTPVFGTPIYPLGIDVSGAGQAGLDLKTLLTGGINGQSIQYVMIRGLDGLTLDTSAKGFITDSQETLIGITLVPVGSLSIPDQVALAYSLYPPTGDFLYNIDLEGLYAPTIAQVAAYIRLFRQTFGYATGQHLNIYTNEGWIGQAGANAAQADLNTIYAENLWVADPNSKTSPSVPPGWKGQWAFWQFGQAMIGGYTIDTDYINGDVAAYWKANAPAAIPVPAPTSPTPVTKYTNQDKVHLRQAAGLTAPIIDTLAIGAALLVLPLPPITASGLNWAIVVNSDGTARGYIDQEFLSDTKPVITPSPVITVTKQVYRNFVGFFCFPDTPESFYQMVGRLASTPHFVPIVTMLNEGGKADRIKTLSPRTIVVFRPERGNPQPGTNPQVWYDQLYGSITQSELADFDEYGNEDFTAGDIPDPAEVTFYSGLIDVCARNRRHITVMDYAMGHGNPTDVDSLLAKITANGDVLNYHAYSQNTSAGDASMYPDVLDLELRWLPWLKATPGAKVLFGEAGNGKADFQGVSQTMVLMKQFNDIMQPYGQYILGGGSWWCLGGECCNWKQSDCSAVLPAYEQYVISL